MRFFSNDKDSRDDQQGVDVQDEHPERVSSDPVSVPPQRSGSPWSSTPDGGDTPDADLAARDRGDGTDDDGVRFHEPAPQPTAFGASTVGGAVAASAMANPQNDTWSATDRESAANSGVGDDRTVAPGDGIVLDRGGPAPVAGSRGDDVVDVALDDQGGFDDPHVRDAGTTTREDTTPPDARTDVAPVGATAVSAADAAGIGDRDPALRDDGTFDAPQAVDPDTDRPLAGPADSGPAESGPVESGPVEPGPAESGPAAVPVPAAAPVATGTAVASGGTGSLFDAGDAQGFQERWRDVQLRFVDSPKEATAEAAGLVDEVVDRLAANLRAQKGTLGGGGGDDTEKLRIELRAYRDMLNRILAL